MVCEAKRKTSSQSTRCRAVWTASKPRAAIATSRRGETVPLSLFGVGAISRGRRRPQRRRALNSPSPLPRNARIFAHVSLGGGEPHAAEPQLSERDEGGEETGGGTAYRGARRLDDQGQHDCGREGSHADQGDHGAISAQGSVLRDIPPAWPRPWFGEALHQGETEEQQARQKRRTATPTPHVRPLPRQRPSWGRSERRV